jgi:hypothetical protein
MEAGLSLTKYELYDARMFGSPRHRKQIFAYVRGQQSNEKLHVAPANSAEEQQADAVAKKAVAGENTQTPPPPSTAQTTAPTPAITADFEEKLYQSKGHGEPLNESLRAEMQGVTGADLSDVKVHTDANANQMADAINAQAFTHGKDVYLGSGQSAENKELMAHELWHVKQSNGDEIIKRKPQNEPLAYGMPPEVMPNWLKGKTLKLDADGDGYHEIELMLWLDTNKVLQLQMHHLDSDFFTNISPFTSRAGALVVFNYQSLGVEHHSTQFTPENKKIPIAFENKFKIFDAVSKQKPSYYLHVGADKDFRTNGKYHVALGLHKIEFQLPVSKIKKHGTDISFTETRKSEYLSGPVYTFIAGQQGDEIELQINREFGASVPQEMIDQNRTAAYSIYGFMKKQNDKIVRWKEPVMVYSTATILPASLEPVYQDEKMVMLGIAGSVIPDFTIYYYTLAQKNHFFHTRDITLHFTGPAIGKNDDKKSFTLVNNFPVANSKFHGEEDYHSLLEYEAPAELDNQPKPLSITEDIAKQEAILLQMMQRLVLDGSMNQEIYLTWKDYLLSRTVLEVVKNAQINNKEEKEKRDAIIFDAAAKANTFSTALMQVMRNNGYSLTNSDPGKTILAENWAKEEVEFEELHDLLDNYVVAVIPKNLVNNPPDYIHESTASQSQNTEDSTQYRLPTDEEWAAYETQKKAETDSARAKLRNEAQAEGLNETQQHDKLIQSYTHFSAYRNQLKKIEDKQHVQKINAVFYGTTPEHIEQFNKTKTTNAVAVPLPIWVYVENNEWHIIDLINPQLPFTATVPYYPEQGSTPPDALFEQLNHEKHLPKGYIYYQVGDEKKVIITNGEQTQWYDLLGYIALGLGMVGLTIATFGAALPAEMAVVGTIVSYASIVTGALSTAGDTWDSYTHGQLTNKTLLLNMLDLAGALLQLKTLSISLLLRSESMAAQLPKALKVAQLVYLPLKIGEYSTEGIRLLIITADAAEQIKQIIDAPGDDESKKRALVTLLSQIALSLSMYIIDVKDYGDEVNLVSKAGRKTGADAPSTHTEPDISIKKNKADNDENITGSVVEAAGEAHEEMLGGEVESTENTIQKKVIYGKDETGFYLENLNNPGIKQRVSEAEFYNARLSITHANTQKTGKLDNPAKVSVDALLLLIAVADLNIQAANYPAGILAGVSTATLLLRKGLRGMINKLKAKNPAISDNELLDALKKSIHDDAELTQSLNEKELNSIDDVEFEMPDGSKKKFDEIAQEEIDHTKKPEAEQKKIEAEQEAAHSNKVEKEAEDKTEKPQEEETAKPKEEVTQPNPEIVPEKKIEYWKDEQLTHIPGNPEYLKITLNGDPKQIITLRRDEGGDWFVQRSTEDARKKNKWMDKDILERVPERYRNKTETINPNEDVTQNTSNEVENKNSEIQKDNSENITSRKSETGAPTLAKRKTILKVGEPILNGKINRVRAGDEKKIVIIGLDMNGHVIPIAKELQSQGFDVEILDDNFLNGRTFEIDGKQWTVTEAYIDMIENPAYDKYRNKITNRIESKFLNQVPMYKVNQQWILEHNSLNTTIIDVGAPLDSNKSSTFYDMEVNSVNWDK